MSGLLAVVGFMLLIVGAWPGAIVAWALALLFDNNTHTPDSKE